MNGVEWPAELSEEWPSEESGVTHFSQGLGHGDLERFTVSDLTVDKETAFGTVKINSVQDHVKADVMSDPPWKNASLSDLFSSMPAEGLFQTKNTSVSTPSKPNSKQSGESSRVLSESSNFHASESLHVPSFPLFRNQSTMSSVVIQNQFPSFDPFQSSEIRPSPFTSSLSFSIPSHTSLDRTPKAAENIPATHSFVPQPLAKENFSFVVENSHEEIPDVAQKETFVPLFQMGEAPYEDLIADLEELEDLDTSSIVHENKRIKVDFDDVDEELLDTEPKPNHDIGTSNSEKNFFSFSQNHLSTIVEESLEDMHTDLTPKVLSPAKSASSTVKSQYPENIDFIEDLPEDLIHADVDFPEDNALPQTTSNEHNQRDSSRSKSKMITIRNLNASNMMMNMIGDHHNMSFNEEKKCWEGAQDEEIFGHSISESNRLVDIKKPESPPETVRDDESVVISGLDEMEDALVDLNKIEITRVDDVDVIESEIPITMDEPRSRHSSSSKSNLASPAPSTASKPPCKCSEVKATEPISFISSRSRHSSRRSIYSPASFATSSRSLKRDDSSSESIFVNILKALKLEDEMKMVTRVDLAGYNMHYAKGLSQHLPNLKELDMSNNRLKYLNDMPDTIQILDVSRNQLSNLTSFSHLPHLKYLNISNTNITNLSALRSLIHLKELQAANNNIDDISGLKELDSLEVLNLRKNKIGAIGLTKSNLRSLVSLDLSENEIMNFGEIESLQALRELVLDSNKIYRMSLKSDMPCLTTLSLNDNDIDMFDCRHLINLATLFVDRNKLGPFLHEYKIETLTVISAEHQEGSECLDINLNQFPNLKELRVSGCDLGQMIPLRGGRRLQALVANSTGIASIRALGTKHLLRNLRGLDLSQNPIISIIALSGAYMLKGLWLSECQLKYYGQVLKVVKKLKFLEVLDLRYNPMIKSLYSQDIDPSLHTHGFSGGNEVNELTVSQKSLVGAGRSQFHHSTSLSWIRNDEAYCKSLNDVDFVKRQCYRVSIINSLKDSIRVLDGIEVTAKDKKAAKSKMDRLKKIVKGKERYFKEFAENLTESHEDLGDVEGRFRELDISHVDVPVENEEPENAAKLFSPFRDWKPVSLPLSTLSNRTVDESASADEVRIEIPTPHRSRSMSRL